MWICTQYLCRFVPNDCFRNVQIWFYKHDKQLIVATSQVANRCKQQPRSHPRHQQVCGGAVAMDTASFSKHMVWLMPKGWNTMQVPLASVVWLACTDTRLRWELTRHPINSWGKGCLYMLEILVLNIVDIPMCSKDCWMQ